jgi:diacylglycerol kinase family enzyme
LSSCRFSDEIFLTVKGGDAMALTSMAHVIWDRGSGAGDKEALIEEIETAFKVHGWQVECIEAGQQDLQRLTRQALTQRPGAIVVAGGDGTIRTVAAACVEVNRPIGIIPAGTFNYIARNLKLPTTVPEAVSIIVAGRMRQVDCGKINGQLFLNNAGFGLYATMIERRERDKRRFGRRRVVAFISGLCSLFSAHPLYAVELVADGRPVRRRTTTLFFGCNALQLQDFNVTAAECLRHQQLAILSLRFHRRWEIALAACAALLGRLDRAANTEVFCARSVQVQTRRRALKVAIDGEVMRLRPPLDVEFHPGLLQVFAPIEELD